MTESETMGDSFSILVISDGYDNMYSSIIPRAVVTSLIQLRKGLFYIDPFFKEESFFKMIINLLFESLLKVKLPALANCNEK